ncbi:MAG: Bax inhibitor-1/YccA family protein [Rhizobiales bacterium]|nr:Bax inhibitor-1/YccA family protein [Hyphomicrobiales bacterium]MBI3673177.1 Bax inhibitor-1/YccA family protein [Hyphomicrobiales bacterium]
MAEVKYQPQTQTSAQVAIDQGLRAYMLRVYNYMAAGLAITGVTAVGTYLAAVDTSSGTTQLTAFGQALFTGPLMWVLLLGTLGLVFFLSFRINSMSVSAAQTTFWIYAALVGVTFASLGLVYTQGSIARVFLITAGTFGAMSLYGYTTKRDLTGMGSFLFMGLIGIIIASLVNIFFQSSAAAFAISVIGVIVFTGLTAYDTQKIKEMYYADDEVAVMGRKAIMGALSLYLDFINLFLQLLRLFGNRN